MKYLSYLLFLFPLLALAEEFGFQYWNFRNYGGRSAILTTPGPHDLGLPGVSYKFKTDGCCVEFYRDGTELSVLCESADNPDVGEKGTFDRVVVVCGYQ